MQHGYKTPAENIDLAGAERTIRKAGTLGFLLFGIAVGVAYFVLPAIIHFPEDLAERLAFAAQVSAPVLFCVLVAIGMVSTGRRLSAVDIGGSAAGPPSERIAIYVAYLQNTLEQALIAIGFYFAFASLVEGPWLAVLPVSAAFFIIGRILFLRGYSQGVEGRAFGMVMTMTPAIIGYPAVFVLMVLNWL